MKKTLMEKSIICKNCGSENIGNFCSNCGQKTHINRFTLKSFFNVFLSAFNIERGFFYTIKMLFKNPGKVINDYLYGRTKVYYNPLNYLIILAGLSAIFMIWFNIFDANVKSTSELMGMNQNGNTNLLSVKLQTYIKQYLNVLSMVIIPFISLVSMWFYHKRKLFYGEHLVLNCFLFGQVSIINIILSVFYKVFPVLISYSILIGYLAHIMFYAYALKSIFKNSWVKSTIGSIVINIGGMILFFVIYTLAVTVIIIILVVAGFNIKELVQ